MKGLKILGFFFFLLLLVTLFPKTILVQEAEKPLSLDTTIRLRTQKVFPARVFSAGAAQDCIEIDFEGIGNNTQIGTISGTPKIPHIIFGSSWLGLVDSDAGGSGNFANEPSQNTVAYFLDMNDISINFDAGVQLVEFYYVAAAQSLPITISAYDIDRNLIDRATGNTIGTSYDGAACSGDPSGQFCLWDKVTLASTSNNIRQIELVGTIANYFGIDNLKICVGQCSPPSGQLPEYMRIPITDGCCWSNSNNCLEKRNFAGNWLDDCLLSEIVTDSGEKIQLWCISGALPCWVTPGLAHYELHYYFPDGIHYRIGVCPFEGGRNNGEVFYSGDNDSNGKLDCFIRVVWTSRDQQAGDRDDDGDGKIDWWVFTYDVINNSFKKVNYESLDGPGGSDPDVIARTDPYQLGPETEAMLDILVAEFEQIATAGDVPMGGTVFKPCDLNQDGRCDASDLVIFQNAFGSCEGESNFNSNADFNGDGCVTTEDHSLLFPPVIEVDIDIKPADCPDYLNMRSAGILPVALLGTSYVDVKQIDPDSIRLEGVAPKRFTLEDVTRRFLNCTNYYENPDGYLDLALKFDCQQIVSKLMGVQDGDRVALTLTGNLKREFGGTAIRGNSVVIILKK